MNPRASEEGEASLSNQINQDISCILFRMCLKTVVVVILLKANLNFNVFLPLKLLYCTKQMFEYEVDRSFVFFSMLKIIHIIQKCSTVATVIASIWNKNGMSIFLKASATIRSDQHNDF